MAICAYNRRFIEFSYLQERAVLSSSLSFKFHVTTTKLIGLKFEMDRNTTKNVGELYYIIKNILHKIFFQNISTILFFSEELFSLSIYLPIMNMNEGSYWK